MFKKVYPVTLFIVAFFVITNTQGMEQNPIVNTNTVCGKNMDDSFLSLSSSENSNEVEIDDEWRESYYDDYIKKEFIMVNEENFNMIETVLKEPFVIIEDYRNEASVKKPSETKETTTQLVASSWPTLHDVYAQASDLASNLPGDIQDIVSFIIHDKQQLH